MLSVKAVTGVPVKFIGTGEHLDALQEFHPDGWPSRIWAWATSDAGQAGPAEARPGGDGQEEERMRKGEFTLDDFRK